MLNFKATISQVTLTLFLKMEGRMIICEPWIFRVTLLCLSMTKSINKPQLVALNFCQMHRLYQFCYMYRTV